MKNLFILLLALPVSSISYGDAISFNCVLRQGRTTLRDFSLTIGGPLTTIDIDKDVRALTGAAEIPEQARKDLGDIYFGIELQDKHKPIDDSNVIASAWSGTEQASKLVSLGLFSLTLTCRR